MLLFSFFIGLSFFCYVKGFKVEMGPTILVDQAASATWTRNSPSDPAQFILRSRSVGSINSAAPQEQRIDSQGNEKGQAVFLFLQPGTFIIEVFSDSASKSPLCTSSNIQVIAVDRTNTTAISIISTLATTASAPDAISTKAKFRGSTSTIEATDTASTRLASIAFPSSTSHQSYTFAVSTALSSFASASPHRSGTIGATETTSTSSTTTTSAFVAGPLSTAAMSISVSKSRSKARTPIIVGSTIGALLLLFLLFLAFIKVRRARRERRTAAFFRHMIVRQRNDNLVIERKEMVTIGDPKSPIVMQTDPNEYPFSSYHQAPTSPLRTSIPWVSRRLRDSQSEKALERPDFTGSPHSTWIRDSRFTELFGDRESLVDLETRNRADSPN
ncbi:hypothetical protein C8J56DRAFT_1168205 [Mycena floridula]|nr:hypothetical protein C8J56DRAFT_1168205 [Mycena floridula]